MSTKKICKAKKSKRRLAKEEKKTAHKITESRRKMRKTAKKLKKQGLVPKRRAPEGIRIPNNFPRKKEMLEALLQRKEGEKLQKELNSKSLAEQRALMLEKALLNKENEERMEIEKSEEDIEVGADKDANVKNRMKPIKYILENADVLLEVLDVRDPIGCRCYAIEKKYQAENPGKKIILVLNKVDLVPIDIANSWKKILSREFPTILFKSNLQEQTSNLSSNKLYNKSAAERPEMASDMLSSSKAVGTEKLMELLKNYSRDDAGKVAAVSVGVIGYPNVGKSSLINSMARRRSAGTSASAGYTKHVQEIEIDSKITVIDTPGVIAAKADEITLVLRNTISPGSVQNPEKAVDEILKRVKKEQLIKLYGVTDYSNAKELSIRVAEKKGKIKRGGVLHLEEALRMILQDWNAGKIKYYVSPPEMPNAAQKVLVMEEEQ